MSQIKAGNELADKFDFYITGLIFTVLGLSIQTAQSRNCAINYVEIMSWALLFLSGLLSLWRLEWLSSLTLHMGFAGKFHSEGNLQQSAKHQDLADKIQKRLLLKSKGRRYLLIFGFLGLILARAAWLIQIP